MKKYVWIGLVFLVIFGVFFYALSMPTNKPELTIDTVHKRLGDISQAAGDISTDFLLTNTGDGNLVIKGMDTSCLCTTAEIINGDEVGPTYGMGSHGNPQGWSTTIEPGHDAILRVTYDPNAHGKFNGPVTRTVSILSNTPIQEARISLNQVE